MLTLPQNIENICRLCLTESVDGNDMLPLFPVRGGNPYGPNTVVSKIFQCTTIKIEHYQGAPTTICEYCSARLEDWQTFREQCVGTDEYLKATYKHIFCPEEALADAIIKHQQQQNERQQQQQQYPQQRQHLLQQQQQKQKTQQQRQHEFFEEMTELPPADDENGSYLIGEEISPEDMMDQQDGHYYDPYDDEDDQQDDQQGQESLVQQMNRRNGIRVPKWSKEFGAKLNSLLHVVGGDRPHQCKVCRKRFLRRPHCRRHVAQAHGAVIDSVKLPKNWELNARRRFVFSKAPVQRVMEPVPPPPAPREDHYDPTPERPHQCEVCKKCFKRSQHLRRHRSSHLQIEIDRSEIMRGITEQQRAQQQLEKLISPTDVKASEYQEDDDVIALSDDDEDMGEEISPEEFIGQYDGSNDLSNGAVPEPPEQPRLSDIPHIFYGSEDEFDDDDDPSQYMTKNGTIRKRAPPLAKLPGERPYLCRHCQKTFKRSDHLKSHLKTHRKQTDYHCEWCQKGFRYRQNYLIHVKNKTCLGERRGLLSGHIMPKLMPKPGMKGAASNSDDELVLGD